MISRPISKIGGQTGSFQVTSGILEGCISALLLIHSAQVIPVDLCMLSRTLKVELRVEHVESKE